MLPVSHHLLLEFIVLRFNVPVRHCYSSLRLLGYHPIPALPPSLHRYLVISFALPQLRCLQHLVFLFHSFRDFRFPSLSAPSTFCTIQPLNSSNGLPDQTTVQNL